MQQLASGVQVLAVGQFEMIESAGTRMPAAMPRVVAADRRGWVWVRKGMETRWSQGIAITLAQGRVL